MNESQSPMQSKDKFVAFVDLLGFKSLVSASETGDGLTSQELSELLEAFGNTHDASIFSQYGPIICPEAKYIERNLDFKLTQVSDCVVVSTEVSPAGLINLMNHCMKVLIRFLQKGFMCRGYITRGILVHSDSRLFGTGYQRAYQNEALVSAFKREADERGTPFVEIDDEVRDYALTCGDRCVPMMFNRLTRSDGHVSALFPFARFSHSFSIGPMYGLAFEPQKERDSNDVVRKMLLSMKAKVLGHVDHTNRSALSKAEHYVQAINNQLLQCDECDHMLDRLGEPFQQPTAYGRPIIPKS